MHYKAVFALAGVFLVIAVVVPLVIFYIQAQNDLIIIQNPTGTQTSGNVTSIPTPEQVAASHQTILLIVLIIDVVFIALFVVTLYYGINHLHPTH